MHARSHPQFDRGWRTLQHLAPHQQVSLMNAEIALRLSVCSKSFVRRIASFVRPQLDPGAKNLDGPSELSFECANDVGSVFAFPPVTLEFCNPYGNHPGLGFSM